MLAGSYEKDHEEINQFLFCPKISTHSPKDIIRGALDWTYLLSQYSLLEYLFQKKSKEEESIITKRFLMASNQSSSVQRLFHPVLSRKLAHK
jgi:hypothetical protein